MTARCFAADADSKTPQEVFNRMREHFHAQKAIGVHAKYQWHLRDPQSGDWWVRVDDGKCKIEKVKIDNPDVTFFATGSDWVAISEGKLNGVWAFFSGRLNVQGSHPIARKLDEMFP